MTLRNNKVLTFLLAALLGTAAQVARSLQLLNLNQRWITRVIFEQSNPDNRGDA